jgi:hypothetical protein
MWAFQGKNGFDYRFYILLDTIHKQLIYLHSGFHGRDNKRRVLGDSMLSAQKMK